MTYETLATKTLTNELELEIARHMQTFVREDRTLNPFVISSWLQSEERDKTIVQNAMASTNGSDWELSCELGATLQSLVDDAYERIELECSVRDITHVDLFDNLLSFWRMDDGISDDETLIPHLSGNHTTQDVHELHSW